MHALLALSTALLVVLSGLGLLRAVCLSAGASRRLLQGLVLAAPLVGLAFGAVALHHFSGRACVLRAPLWDMVLATAVPVGAGLVALGGLGSGSRATPCSAGRSSVVGTRRPRSCARWPTGWPGDSGCLGPACWCAPWTGPWP